MKRILVLALALILVVSSLVVPSYAVGSVPDNVVNLLTADFYDLYLNGTYGGNNTIPSFFNIDNIKKVGIQFLPNAVGSFNKIIVTYKLVKQPSNTIAYVNNYDGSTTGISGELLYIRDSYYTFEYSYSGSIDSLINFVLNFYDGYYTGDLSIVGIWGYASNSFEITTVDSYFSNAVCFPIDYDEHGNPIESFGTYIPVVSGSNSLLPISYDWYGPAPNDESLFYGESFFKIDVGKYGSLNSLTFLILTSGDILSYGSTLVSSDGSVLAGLSSSITDCGLTQYLFQSFENLTRYRAYLVTVDLSGLDLSDAFCSLTIETDRVWSSAVIDYDYGYAVMLQSVVARSEDSSIPWYVTMLQRISGYISQQTSSLLSGISSFATNVSSWISSQTSLIQTSISDLGTNLYGWIKNQTDSLQRYINNLGININTWFSGWFDTLFSILNSSGDNEKFQDDVSQQGDKLDDMAGIMDSVNKPDLDSINTDLSGIVSAADTANIAHVYTMVIGDGFVGQIMTMVVIMAMMSFVLFGKR